ncbi:hypothetical protein [Yaniella halotolerans]|uniref:hypothetical protein n=1 Tax=Yaniella halotolerans TaxID=225453 RepID=UPI0003B42060|nr:hypothetical protein [Yaniella halotolerans]
MNNISRIAALTISGVALAGCSLQQSGSSEEISQEPEDSLEEPVAATPDSTVEAPEPPATTPGPTVTDPEEAAQEWADGKYDQWLQGMHYVYRLMCGDIDTIENYRACVPDDPHGYITEFTAEEIGDLHITIGPGPWEGGTYDTERMLGARFVGGK